MIERRALISEIEVAFKHVPIVSLLGPRQSGKTTLSRAIARNHRRATHFDLEDPTDAVRLASPMMTLEPLRGLVVIDEVQRHPRLFEVLRVLADRPRRPARFLILGSVDPRLVKGVSESLAGRVYHVDVSGFNLDESTPARFQQLWRRGGFPRSFLARTEAASVAWRTNYVRDFLQRDLAELSGQIPTATLARFWNMVAHYHGGTWNAAEFARALGSSESTARRYLDVLSNGWAVRQLQPWHENMGKRQMKSPKIYVQDSGLLHALLGLTTQHELMGHVKSGASWEGFAIEQVLSLLRVRDAYFWGTHQGAELDLLVMLHGKRFGFEMKLTETPSVTKSMRIALEDLGLAALFVLYPGRHSFQLDERIEAIAIQDLPRRVADLR